jgi:hypothetical protein
MLRLSSSTLARALVAGLLVATAAGCLSPAAGFCEAAAECDSSIFGIELDGVGSAPDSARVCTVEKEGEVRAFYANEERRCHEVAAAYEIYMACAADNFARTGDGCDAIGRDCEDELDDYSRALGNRRGNECTENSR